MKRWRIQVAGLVQGVGFRPFVCQLAMTHSLTGFVRNNRMGVRIEVQGHPENLKKFLCDIDGKSPVASRIDRIEQFNMEICKENLFSILETDQHGCSTVSMPRDRAPCRLCLDDFYDPDDRRYHYSFITCNDCGPRFTIAKALPFDRENTTMDDFVKCTDCLLEYQNPMNRRFHAQTISCPLCGPKLTLIQYKRFDEQDDPFVTATEIIRNDGVLALKGVGGYQLICSANSELAIARLRTFKQRSQKPFAVLAKSIADISEVCHVSPAEEDALSSPESPVVILYVKDFHIKREKIHAMVSPGLDTLGVILPSSPIHRRLIDETGSWLVVTSANLRGEPMVTDDDNAKNLLSEIADGILTHNRDIVHLADDSVVRFAGAMRIVLRHARGLAPSDIYLPLVSDSPDCDLAAYGGHTKASFAVALGTRLVLSQHIGDLESRSSRDTFVAELESFKKIYGVRPEGLVAICDEHPLYGSTALAEMTGGRVSRVFHHEAHLHGLMAESPYDGRALAVVCDGSGLGRDGSIWGGEFFIIDGSQSRRIGSLRPFSLPGGDLAAKDLRRIALALLYETELDATRDHSFVQHQFDRDEGRILLGTLSRNLNCPRTTSLGRLFDGLAALSGICRTASYEAHAAMLLENLAKKYAHIYTEHLPVEWFFDHAGHRYWDWSGVVTLAEQAMDDSEGQGRFAAVFHHTLVQMFCELALDNSVTRVLLTGGVFQNALLIELTYRKLLENNILVVIHDRVPPGDGGLALGQVAWARREGGQPCV